MTSDLCRIGVFYDGSYFSYAQHFFYHERKKGWLDATSFQAFLERYVASRDQGYRVYKIVYSGWYQGLGTSTQCSDDQLRQQRHAHQGLMRAGILMKFSPKSSDNKEKGVDVSLAVDVMENRDRLDIVVLVTGDGDFVPMVRALNRSGVRVLVVYFQYTEESGRKSFCNHTLLEVSDYGIDINSLERNPDERANFESLFLKYRPTDMPAQE